MSIDRTMNDSTGDVAGGHYEDAVKRVQHELLVPSPTNPRKHFPPGPLRELADNILALARRAIAYDLALPQKLADIDLEIEAAVSAGEVGTLEQLRNHKADLQRGAAALGVQQPLFARMMPGVFQLEIIAGERRYRATELAMELARSEPDAPQVIQRLRLLPVLVKSWTDDEVIEFQLIENLRRDDLTPLEEADGYQRMLSMGNTPEQISAKVGSSVDQVRKALKWARLPELPRLAFEKGIIGKEHATLIARIPDARERRVASVMMMQPTEWRDESFEDDKKLAAMEQRELKDLDDPENSEPLAVRRLRALLADKFMASLSGAPFAQDDATLMPVQMDAAGERQCGGACSDCPFRTGNSELFRSELSQAGEGEGKTLGLDGNVCTKPSCRKEKIRLQWEKDVAEANSKGVKVLAPKEAEKVFYSGTDRLQYGTKYVALDTKPSPELLGHGNTGKVKTWEKLVEDTGVEVVIAQDGNGSTRKLVEASAAVLAVNTKLGVRSPFAKTKPGAADEDKWKAEEKKRQQEAKFEKKVFGKVLAELLRVASGQTLDLEVTRWMAREALEGMGMDGLRALASGLGVKPVEPKKGGSVDQGCYLEAILDQVGHETPHGVQMALIFVSLAAQGAWALLKSEPLKDACELLGVDIAKVKAAVKDEEKQKKSKTSAKAPLKPGEKGVRAGAYDVGDSGAPAKPGARTEPETVYEADEHYHCDVCGLVCEVPPERIEKVEAMKHGEFQCCNCDRAKGFAPLSDEQQKEWASWVPGDEKGYAGHASAAKPKGKGKAKK